LTFWLKPKERGADSAPFQAIGTKGSSKLLKKYL
jgi:hypothetical protein